MSSKDLLEKLFDVEREAEAMVAEAREEAGRRVDQAKIRAQKHYTEAYDAARERAASSRERSEAAARAEYEAALEAFRVKLESSKLAKDAFKAACDAALEEGF